jgi:nucleoside-diphosphate-sugar epimerase
VIIGSYEKAKQILGWHPKYNLEEGLRETVQYWRQLNERKVKCG